MYLPTAVAQAGAPPAAPGAAAIPPQPAAVANSAVPAGDSDVVVTNGSVFDFGETSFFETSAVEHVFRLKNATDEPLTIGRLESSCGCTSAVIDARGTVVTQAPATARRGAVSLSPLAKLAPGEEAGVRVTVSLEKLPPGRVHKTVTVVFAGEERPAVKLEMEGTLRPTISLTPTFINLGQVPTGTSRSVRVNVTLDARLAAAGPVPGLICTDESPYRVTPLPPETDVPANAARTLSPAIVSRTYLVTLTPDAPLGLVKGRIGFALLQSPSPSSDSGEASESSVAEKVANRGGAAPEDGHEMSAAERIYRGVTGNVVANVVGDVSARPLAENFGVVGNTAPTTRRVTLTGKTPAAIAGLTMETIETNPCLTARLLPPKDDQPQTRTIEVTYDPSGAQPGVQSARIRVNLANGQHMDIPISAYIRPPEPGK